MGIYDRIRIEKAFPELGLTEGAIFQTKNLHAAMGEFTITATGKLVEHYYRYESNPDKPLPLLIKIPIRDQVIDYHGDLLLHGPDNEGRWNGFVARFTDGMLEWIRPMEEYPEANKELLFEQGER